MGVPRIVNLSVYPVAGRDSMELNLSGAHAPYFTRNILILRDSAGNLGVGADFAVGKGMAFRVLAKDYIGKFNFQDATGLGITGETAHNFALSAGMRFDF